MKVMLAALSASLALGACATKTESIPGDVIVYPNDLQHYSAVAPVRWADPGDLIWLNVLERRYWDLDGFSLTARNPLTGEKVTRVISHWRSAQEGGGVRYYAPEAFWFVPYYKAIDRDGERVLVRTDVVAPDMPPPYVCVRGDKYWQANLTWTLGKCRPGKPVGPVNHSLRADLRQWTEQSIRLESVEAGLATFVISRRQSWQGLGTGEPASLLPNNKTTAQRISSRVGTMKIPKGVPADIDVEITAIEGDRVSYRLLRRTIDCPDGCVDE